MRSHSARIALALVGATTVAALAHAALPEEAPPESRAQVDAALRALAPALATKTRRLAPGDPGTIEHVIAAYAPGTFHLVGEGTLPAPRPPARCPADMANVGDRFCVDRYEGSLVERRDDGALQPWSPFLTPPEGTGRVFLAQSVAGVVPQGYISGAQAERACAAAHKRLCQTVEWRAACAGTQGTAYPYGPTRIAGKCHDTGVAPMLALHAAELKTGWGPAALNDPRANQLEGTVAKTGAFPDCTNDLGVYDMVGNLDEWTADPNGTFQGGFWLDTDLHGEACAYRTIAHDFAYHDYSTGFRCCKDAEAAHEH
jgi:sulfatase modifying factor 1